MHRTKLKLPSSSTHKHFNFTTTPSLSSHRTPTFDPPTRDYLPINLNLNQQPSTPSAIHNLHSTSQMSQMDEINTLLRHPTLYDPVLKPRFPIVLCHGLYGFDVRGPAFFRLHYWGDLLKILRGKVGAEVFVTAVPGTGAVRQRARAMHESLEQTTGLLGRDLNFIAHSMGGLDARYLISNIRPETYHPRSLTTLSTPHRGSEFMAWCRTNIGIGTDFDKTSEAAAATAHTSSHPSPSLPLIHDESLIPLPFSLKSPILTREAEIRIEKESKEAERNQVKKNLFGILPITLSNSVSNYLLDLLDSPAYANLTPSFLSDVFNPGTPDNPSVRYFSIAARTEKIGIWHPLWLPKLVLDGAERAREANGIVTDPRWRGNDGLVNVESAKWGEFLGTIEGCDHWEVRGSSGLINAVASAKAVADATQLASAVDEKKLKKDNGPAVALTGEKGRGWSWQDLYALVGSTSSGKPQHQQQQVKKDPIVAAVKSTPPNEKDGGLSALASWIVRHLPGGPTTESSSRSSSKNTNSHSHAQDHHHHHHHHHHNGGSFSSSSTSPRLSTSSSSSSSSSSNGSIHLQSARMLYGVSAPGSKPEKFDLERLSLALCRKLHNEGF